MWIKEPFKDFVKGQKPCMQEKKSYAKMIENIWKTDLSRNWIYQVNEDWDNKDITN